MTDRSARALLVTAIVAAWATSVLGGYQLDDWRVVVDDPRVQDLASWWRSMPGIRPLLKLSWALGHASGLGLAGFHAVNVAIHATSALLAYALLAALGARTGADDARVRLAALLGALLFGLHPAQTEAVTYVSWRSAALSGMLALASVLVWLRGQERTPRWSSSLGSALLFAAAVAVKETAIVLPLAIVAVAATDPRDSPSWRRLLAGIGPHLATAVVAAVVLLGSATYRGMLAESFALRDPVANLATHLRAVTWLTGQVVRPDRLDADPDLAPARQLDAGLVAVGAAIGAVLVAAVVLRQRRPVLALGSLWYVLWLAPTGWVVPRPEPASDRQLYLALLGPAWLVAWWIADRLRLARPIARWSAVGLVVLVAGGATATRSLVYRDEVGFWSDVVAKSPGNARARNNLAVALAAACRREEAEAQLVLALERDPGHVRAAVNLRLLREGAALERRARACP